MADKTTKRKHESLSLAKKVEILRKLDSGQKKVRLAREYNIGRATIYDIKKNRNKIENFVNNTGLDASSRHTLKHCEYLLMEDVLYSWFLEERRHNKTLTEKAIQKKSLHFYKEIYKNDNFKASDGWFRNFKTRYGIRGLYQAVTKKKNTKLNEVSNSTKPNIEKDPASPAKTLVKSEESGLKIEKIVPKTEPQDETTNIQHSVGLAWPDEHDSESAEGDSNTVPEKTELNIELDNHDDSNFENDNYIFISHMKSRMDRLNHQQRFIAQKLMSDVMMLAETNQLQLTSAIVTRALKQGRDCANRNDPLKID